LADVRLAPLDRLSKAVLVFFRSEQQEAALRVALDDSGALFRDAPEAAAFAHQIEGRMLAFFEEALPGVDSARRAFVSKLVLTAMSSIAEKVTAQGLARPAVDAWARENAEMYRAYIESVARAARPLTVSCARPRKSRRSRRVRATR
jgi:hypothetical protein